MQARLSSQAQHNPLAGTTRKSASIKPNRPLSAIAALLCLALLAAACGSSSDTAAEPLAGIVRTPTPAVGDLAVTSANDGSEYALKAETGNLLVLYFGYTACPDVCPTTMADLSAALTSLGSKSENIDVAMLTIDPSRDSDEIISGYVQSFVEGALGLRTADEELLRSIADRFGANYEVETTDDGAIEVSHTGFLYAIDNNGDLVVTWAFGTPAADIEHDLDILLSQIEA